MRTYRCEDVTLSDRGIDSKGWLCNPQEKGKKPAILVLGPKDASNNTVLLQYATRLANYGFVVLGMEETQNVKAAIDYLSLKDEVPEICPQCKQPKSKFKELVETEGALTFVDEHRLGVAKGVDPEVLEGLRAHFNGECSEVGMYLAMSRQADREGYPEIAEAFKRYAFEEAEHAAKFAELLGECVWDTKTNLKKRMEAEAGACEDKKRIATLAKKLDLDAIHDTVHEMCKDEARHGKGFEGLYNRYFK